VSGQPIADPYIDPEIHISTDAESNTLVIQDFGIGMTKEDLINNLGTIARSGKLLRFPVSSHKFRVNSPNCFPFPGTLEYVKKTDNATNLIGQFGVGFYSAFMVADEVLVYSRSAIEGSPGYQWKSQG
jgi:HSP90 family molecular chaperone